MVPPNPPPGDTRRAPPPEGATQAEASAPLIPDIDHPGDWIGPYKILELLGEGGFGTVWLAERRDAIVQRVALKVLKPGMDSRAVVARFEQERQALAVMDHPNVAKVFDAGTTPRGLPYFVMEHVAGEPITTYCDRHNLSIRQRLELFIPVCQAVQHAHHKGLIHRDLKPSNILVSVREGRAIPKVIDFGVAKAISHTLTEKTIFTAHGVLIGTPEYMSPEQAEMGATDVDTRTDVYSLGVILYELLSGLLPFDPASLRSAGYDAIRRIIRDQDPPKPSTRLSTAEAGASAEIARKRQSEREALSRELRRELDWIPLKALRKDRTQRYRTPEELADDISRYLRGEALEAGPESAGYRARKFLRRHRAPVMGAAAVAAALLLGFAGTAVGFIRAEQRATSERKAKQDALTAKTDADTAREAEKTAKEEAIREKTEAVAARAEADRARENAEFEAYVANLIAGDASLAGNEPNRVRARLDACPEHLRGWEWRLLDARADDSLMVLKGHEKRVYFALFSPDGSRILTVSDDSTARVWETATGKVHATLQGHKASIRSVAFSPDGLRVVTVSGDGELRVWDANTGTSLLTLGNEKPSLFRRSRLSYYSSATFSPEGRRIVSTCLHTVQVLDAETGKTLATLTGHDPMQYKSFFSPDGRRVLTRCGDMTACVWDAATGEELAVLPGHTGMLMSATFSPDGARVVTASSDKTARVWDAASGAELHRLGHGERVNEAAFSPDGSRVATASGDATARLWDAVNGSELATLPHPGFVSRVFFSPDGTRVVTASDNVRVWDAADGKPLAVLRTGSVSSVFFNPDGTRLVTSGWGNAARVWDPAWTEQQWTLAADGERYPLAAAMTREGVRVVMSSKDTTVGLWDPVGGREVATLTGHERRVWKAAFSPDGTRVVTAALSALNDAIEADPSIRERPPDTPAAAHVWDTATGQRVALLTGHQRSLGSAVFSGDGTKVLTTSSDDTARMWDAASGEQLAVLTESREGFNFAAMSADGTRVVGTAWDEEARVWDVASGRPVAVLRGHDGYVLGAALSPDGSRAVTLGWTDSTARLWDASNGAPLAVLRHEDRVGEVLFSVDNTRFFTASGPVVYVWDASNGRELLALREHSASIGTMTLSEDGTRLVTTSGDGTIRVYDTIPYRIRHAERLARQRGEDGDAIVKAYLAEVGARPQPPR